MAGQKISAMSLVASVTEDMKFPTDQSDGNGGNLAATAQQIADFTGGGPGGEFWPLDDDATLLDNVNILGDSNSLSLGTPESNLLDFDVYATSFGLTFDNGIGNTSFLNIAEDSITLFSEFEGNSSGLSITETSVSIALVGTERFTFDELLTAIYTTDFLLDADGIVQIYGTSGGITVNDETIIESVTVSISSAELLNMNSSPKQIVAAPGAGKFIHVMKYSIAYTHVSAAYVGSTSFFRYGIGGQVMNPSGITLAGHSVSKWFNIETLNLITPANLTAIENKSIVLETDSSNLTTGNGTVKVYISYRIVTL